MTFIHVTKSKHLSDPFLLDPSGAPETTADHTLRELFSSLGLGDTFCHTCSVFLLPFSLALPPPQSPLQVSLTGYFLGNLSHANDPFRFIVHLFLNQ